MYKIKKNIPVPEWGLGKLKYPWAYLEIDDCFDIPILDKDPRVVNQQVSGSLSFFKKKNNKPKYSIVCRRVDDVIRVWRIKDKI